MRVMITGGSGLIGRALTENLVEDGHEVIVLSRNPNSVKNLPKGARAEKWDGATSEGWGAVVNDADAIVNLAGATLSERWSEARKREIRESRVNAGKAIVEAVKAAQKKPRVVIQASAVGYYGPRGVAHVEGGVGNIAETLASAVKAQGGGVLYRHEVTSIRRREACPRPMGRREACPYVIETKRGSFEADGVLANLTPWALMKLWGEDAPSKLRQRVKTLKPISGAFMACLGVDEDAVEPPGGASRPPGGWVDHHQVIVDPAKPLGEGNSIFVSISPKWDVRRAPKGQRAMTISTHTRAAAWYAVAGDETAFEDRKQAYLERLIEAAARALPTLKRHIRLALPGTPLTFERFTHRVDGMVGGFPQKSLWTGWAPHVSRDRAVWLVGDSVFPGQSTAGVTLGALRVVREIERVMPLGVHRREAAKGGITTG